MIENFVINYAFLLNMQRILQNIGQALIDFSKDSWSRVPIDNDTQRTMQKRGINLKHKCIPS